MPAIHCSYTRVSLEPTPARPQGQVVWRPWLVASVAVAGSDPLPCTVCIDTGADDCVFPLSLARRLGLNLLGMPMTTTMGVGSSAMVYHAPVRVAIPFRRAGERAPFHVINLEILAGFTEGLDAQGIGLLGQTGFFDQHSVLFDQPRGVFTINA